MDTWHTYQVEWTATYIKGFIDDEEMFRYEKPENAGLDKWPFDNQFTIKINAAFGGNWGGSHGIDDSVLPQQYIIDYINLA